MKTYKITSADIQAHIDLENSYLAIAPSAISQERYEEMLECLPPNHHTNGSFTMSEMTLGEDGNGITVMCARRTVFQYPHSELPEIHHIIKNVRIEGGNITDDTRINLDDFEDLEAECEEIAEIEANIYGECNSDTYAACKHCLDYVSGDEMNLIGAYNFIQGTGCIQYGSAQDVVYDYLENTSSDFEAIKPLISYMDHEHFLTDSDFSNIAYNVWINEAMASNH